VDLEAEQVADRVRVLAPGEQPELPRAGTLVVTRLAGNHHGWLVVVGIADAVVSTAVAAPGDDASQPSAPRQSAAAIQIVRFMSRREVPTGPGGLKKNAAIPWDYCHQAEPHDRAARRQRICPGAARRWGRRPQARSGRRTEVAEQRRGRAVAGLDRAVDRPELLAGGG